LRYPPQSIREAMGPLTRAVVVVHLFGLTVDANAFHELRISQPEVLFIEDVAHAAGGCDITGREVGSGFDHVMFSFSDSKILGGHGGAIVIYRSDETTDRLHQPNFATSEVKLDPLLALSLRNFTHAIADLDRAGSSHAAGEIAHSFWQRFHPLVTSGGKFCEVGRAVDDLQNRINIRERRNSRVVSYREQISQDNLFIPEFSVMETCWRLPILAETPELRRRITDALRHKGFQASNHYFPLNRLFSTEDLNVSKYVSDRLINLWVDDSVTDLTISETARVINLV
jgi:dTDP-4-amino-4,6-dideoxygalactose transaminase